MKILLDHKTSVAVIVVLVDEYFYLQVCNGGCSFGIHILKTFTNKHASYNKANPGL